LKADRHAGVVYWNLCYAADDPTGSDDPVVLAQTLPAPSMDRLTGKCKSPPTKLIEANGSEPSSSVMLPGLVELS
jgi:hypothetical protein